MRRFLSLVISLMLLSVACTMGMAEEQAPVYLALGDSITTGYGLAEGEKCFTDIVAETKGYTLINRGVDGNTAAGILAQLQDPMVLMDVAKADVITITCGGNDLMGVLYQAVADVYNTAVPAILAVKAEDVTTIMSTEGDARQQALLLAAQTVLEGNAEMGIAPLTEGDALQQALTEYATSMATVLTTIRMANPDVIIILSTQYNPYALFSGAYASIATGVESGVQMLSKTVKDYSMMLGYRVADVYTAFAASETNLCNACMEPLELDFHPNAAGHAVFADCVLAVLDAQ